jgi:hypothetical protein
MRAMVGTSPSIQLVCPRPGGTVPVTERVSLGLTVSQVILCPVPLGTDISKSPKSRCCDPGGHPVPTLPFTSERPFLRTPGPPWLPGGL